MDLPAPRTSMHASLLSMELPLNGSRPDFRPQPPMAMSDKMRASPKKVFAPSRVSIEPSPPPWLRTQTRMTDAQRRGLAYEQKTLRLLSTIFSGLTREWLRYEADGREAHAQPDAWVVMPDEVVAFEIKLTGCTYAHAQLSDLYVPLLSALYDRPVRGLQVCRAASPTTPGPFVTDAHDFIASNLQLATWLLPRP